MTLFYDAKKRAPKTWVMLSVIVTAILIIIMFYVGGRYAVKNKKSIETTQEDDIF